MAQLPSVQLAKADLELIRLTGDLHLYVVQGLGKPVFLGSDCRDGVPRKLYGIIDVVSFHRPLYSKVLGLRRCSGHVVVDQGRHGFRHFHFIIAHPLLGYRVAWDNAENLFNTSWDALPLSEKLGFS